MRYHMRVSTTDTKIRFNKADHGNPTTGIGAGEVQALVSDSGPSRRFSSARSAAMQVLIAANVYELA
jgi:hypothetical protein